MGRGSLGRRIGDAQIRQLRGQVFPDEAAQQVEEGAQGSVEPGADCPGPVRVEALGQAAQTGKIELVKAALAAQVQQKGFALFAAQQREVAAQEVAARGEELVSMLVQREPAGIAPLLETRAIEASVTSSIVRDCALSPHARKANATSSAAASPGDILGDAG